MNKHSSIRATWVLGFLLFVAAICAPSPSTADELRRITIGISGSTRTHGTMPRVSDDGRYVSFTSRAANLVEDDIFLRQTDVFVFDRLLQTTERVSVTSDGAESDGDSEWSSISADGRYVAFASRATNLAPNDENGANDVFVHDRVTGVTRRVSQSSTGVPGNFNSIEPRISANGQVVVFSSNADNLVAGDDNGIYDLFFHVLVSSQTIRIASGSDVGLQLPDISGDGRYVTFASPENLVASDANGTDDVYIYDIQTDTTELISKFANGNAASGRSPSLSSDGRYVTFSSSALDIVGEAYPPIAQIFLYDRQLDSMEIISRSDQDVPLGQVNQHQLSNDGSVLVFSSGSDDYVAADTNGLADVFRRELSTGNVDIVSKGFDGSQANAISEWPDVDTSGDLIVFQSDAVNLVDGAYSFNAEGSFNDLFGEASVYAYDHAGQAMDILSTPVQSIESSFPTGGMSVTPDGSKLYFGMSTDNVLADFENGRDDIYEYNIASETYERIYQTEISGFVDSYFRPRISGSGNRLMYGKFAVNVGLGEQRASYYAYDFLSQNHILVSGTPIGFPNDGQCQTGSDISYDGTVFAFSCNSTNIVAGDTNGERDIFVRDLSASAAERISVHTDGTEGNGRSYSPNMDDAGTKVVFRSYASNLVDNDTNDVRDVFMHDLQTGETTRISESADGEANGISTSVYISPDGRYVSFASLATNLTDGPTSIFYDVFLYDIQANTHTLISRSWDGALADGQSFAETFTPDNKYLVFASEATNIVRNDANDAYDLFFYNIESGAVCRYKARLDGIEGNQDATDIAFSSDASVAALRTESTNLGSWDTNGASDIYLRIGSPFECDFVTAVATLPDLNANGIPDVAVMIPGATTHVEVRDGSTDALISDIDFGTDTALQMTVIPDLDSSGRAEIALLQEQPTGQVRVQIRDSLTGNIVRNLFYGQQYSPVTMRLIDDYNSSGTPEVAVMGSDATDAIRIQVQDAGSGTFLDNVFLGNQGIGKDFVAVADTSGNGMPELGILSVLKGNEQVRTQVWDAVDMTFQTNVWFGNVYQPHTTITMPDINSNGSDEIVAVGVDPATQNIRVQVRDSDTTATLYNIWLGAVNEAVDIKLINDINSDGVADLAVLLKTPGGTGRVRVQSGSDGAFIRNLFFGAVEKPVGLAVMPDYSGNGFEELAALGESAGVRHVQILDTSTGSQINRIDYPL